MLKNYFVITLRTLQRQKGYAIINILGLSVGLASALLIFLYIQDELSFNSQFQNAKNTYRLGLVVTDPEGNVQPLINVPGGWNTRMVEQLSQIQAGTKYVFMGMPTSIHDKSKDKIILTEDILWVAPETPEVMHFPLIQGNIDKVFEQPNSIVMSVSGARKIFGDDDPMGKQLTISHMSATQGKELEVMVTGLVEDYPTNTSFHPDYMINYWALRPYMNFGETTFDMMESAVMPMGIFFSSYVVTNGNITGPEIEDYMDGILKEIIDGSPELQQQVENMTIASVARKVKDVHFDKSMPWELEGGGDMRYIYTFASIALLIIIVASINYMNLATARASSRSREVGLRKTLGSRRRQLIYQFLMESFVMTIIAFILAVMVVVLAIPSFNQITDKTILYTDIFNKDLLLTMFGLLITMAVLSGSYPAFFLSGFLPVQVLKGNFSFSKGSKFIRKTLIALQFGIATILLISSVVVVRQMDMMVNSNLNQAGDQILSIRYGGTAPTDKFLTFKNQLTRDAGIDLVTFGNHLPRLDFFGPLQFQIQFPDVQEEEFQWHAFHVDYDFPETFELKLLAGRYFETGNTGDSLSIILNETAVDALGKKPEEVIGEAYLTPTMNGYSNYDYDHMSNGTIIGVVKDFPYQSIYHEIQPLALIPKPHFIDLIVYVKLTKGKFQEEIAYIDGVWKEMFPGLGFDYWFVNDEFNRMYKRETRVASLSSKFTGLAIFITCVGLFGLASFIAQQKTKEIGIRKALGASNKQILSLLSEIFLKILLISSIAAVPLAWYLSNQWLQNFIYQTPLDWMLFVSCVVVIAVLTVITVSYESLKASMANPINALKYE